MHYMTYRHSMLASLCTVLFYSVKAYIVATNAKTVLQPVHLDASEPWEKWAGLPRNSCDVIIAINLLHWTSFKTADVCVVIFKVE